jgi:hypothetical protein
MITKRYFLRALAYCSEGCLISQHYLYCYYDSYSTNNAGVSILPSIIIH